MSTIYFEEPHAQPQQPSHTSSSGSHSEGSKSLISFERSSSSIKSDKGDTPSTRTSSVSVSEDQALVAEPFQSEKQASSQHAPVSIYGVPGYLEAPDRPIVKGNFYTHIKTSIKSIFSASLVIALAVGYGYSIKVVDLHVTTVGLYGAILFADFITQYTCAIANRWDIVNIVRKKKREAGCPPEKRRKPWQTEAKQDPVLPDPFQDPESAARPLPTPRHHLMNPDAEVSIAVVGYREDEQAWKECLRSLQKQKLKPKCIVGVVDGNDQPDLDMANAFMEEFANHNSLMVHLPILLSALHRQTYFDTLATYDDTRSKMRKVWHRIAGHHTDAQKASLKAALDVVLEKVDEWEAEYNLSSYEALCFSQPHGHKRTAMFTAFAVSLWAVKTKHAIFTTDSDTLVKDDALDEMLTVLQSHGNVGGVTGDVKIWNRAESFLARLCAVRYWFAFNIERACQSWWRCVSCLSGPMSMYRSHDLHVILGMWNIQTFQGKETTFGDDRHLTNQILAQGFKTRYTHRTWCESESPTKFPRWVKQQTRWSKSFFREAFWFPHAFTLHSWWMLVEITKQSLYPFILVATVFRFLFEPTTPFRPLIWLVTMFGIAFIKSCMACLISADPWLMVFSLYGFVYFFGLLPSKIFALLTMNKTTWGTSARSATEIKIGASFIAEFYHLGHLCLWYLATTFGLGFFCSVIFDMPLLPLVGLAGLIPCYMLFYGLPNPLTPFKFLWTKICAVLAAIKSIFVKKSIKLDDSFTSKPSNTLVRPHRPAPVIVIDSPPYESDEKKLISPYASPLKTREKRSDSTASMASVEGLPAYRSRQNSTASMFSEKPMARTKRALSVASMMMSMDKKGPIGRSRADSASSILEETMSTSRFKRSGSVASTSQQEPSPRYKRSDSDASVITMSPPPRYRSNSVASTSASVFEKGRPSVSFGSAFPDALPEEPTPTRMRSDSVVERAGGHTPSPLRSSFSFHSGSDDSSPSAGEGTTSSRLTPSGRAGSSGGQNSSFAPSRLRGDSVNATTHGRRRAHSRPPPRSVSFEDQDENNEVDASAQRHSISFADARARRASVSATFTGRGVPASALAGQSTSANPFAQSSTATNPLSGSLFAASYRMADANGEATGMHSPPSEDRIAPLATGASSRDRSGSIFFPPEATSASLRPVYPTRMRSGSITAARASGRGETTARPSFQSRMVEITQERMQSRSPAGLAPRPTMASRRSSSSADRTASSSAAPTDRSSGQPINPFLDADATPAMARDEEFGSTQSHTSEHGYAM